MCAAHTMPAAHDDGDSDDDEYQYVEEEGEEAGPVDDEGLEEALVESALASMRLIKEVDAPPGEEEPFCGADGAEDIAPSGRPRRW